MRQPKQILVIPFKINNNNVSYAIFKRSDLKFWQGIAGGVEDGETIAKAAIRESFEEAGLPNNLNYIKLDSFSTIPVQNICGDFYWGDNIYNVIEYCFAVNAKNCKIKLSDEHEEYKWVNYNEALQLLKWDSNKNALCELQEKIKKAVIK